MQRQQDDRPTVSEILSLEPLQETARRLCINIRARQKSLSVQQLIDLKQQQAASLKQEKEKDAPNFETGISHAAFATKKSAQQNQNLDRAQ